MEAVVGYSRAVVADGHVWVSGTAPIPADGGEPPEGAYEQAKLCLEIILGALEQAGAAAADVVRTRIYVVPARGLRGGRARARRGLPRGAGRRPPASSSPRSSTRAGCVEIEAEALLA